MESWALARKNRFLLGRAAGPWSCRVQRLRPWGRCPRLSSQDLLCHPQHVLPYVSGSDGAFSYHEPPHLQEVAPIGPPSQKDPGGADPDSCTGGLEALGSARGGGCLPGVQRLQHRPFQMPQCPLPQGGWLPDRPAWPFPSLALKVCPYLLNIPQDPTESP